MSLRFRNSQGTETPVAGLNGTSGELVPSVSLMQSGTKTSDTASWNPDESGTFSIVLTTSMPDTDYVVVCDIHNLSNNAGMTYYVHDKTTSGFQVTVRNIRADSITSTATLNWTAFKLMTDTVHEADSAHISQNTANFAPAFSEVTSYDIGDYCTYNGILYRCTTAHTAGVWVAGHFTAVTVGDELNDKSFIKPVAIINTTLGLTAQDTYTFMEYYQALVSHGFGVGHYILEIQPNDSARVYVNGDFSKMGTVSMNACTLEINILATSPTRAYQMLATALLLGTAGLTAELSASTGAGTSVLRSCVNVIAQD